MCDLKDVGNILVLPASRNKPYLNSDHLEICAFELRHSALLKYKDEEEAQIFSVIKISRWIISYMLNGGAT